MALEFPKLIYFRLSRGGQQDLPHERRNHRPEGNAPAATTPGNAAMLEAGKVLLLACKQLLVGFMQSEYL